jgi:hypothetical protein
LVSWTVVAESRGSRRFVRLFTSFYGIHFIWARVRLRGPYLSQDPLEQSGICMVRNIMHSGEPSHVA